VLWNTQSCLSSRAAVAGDWTWSGHAFAGRILRRWLPAVGGIELSADLPDATLGTLDLSLDCFSRLVVGVSDLVTGETRNLANQYRPLVRTQAINGFAELEADVLNPSSSYHEMTSILDKIAGGDPSVTEVMVNEGGRRVFVERAGSLQPVADRTLEIRNLTVAIKNIARACGDEISERQPILDARLEDGSRVAAMFPPCAVDGPTLTVRKFTYRCSLDDLVRVGTLTEPREQRSMLLQVLPHLSLERYQAADRW
jgi:type II/IV secretion system protein